MQQFLPWLLKARVIQKDRSVETSRPLWRLCYNMIPHDAHTSNSDLKKNPTTKLLLKFQKSMKLQTIIENR